MSLYIETTHTTSPGAQVYEKDYGLRAVSGLSSALSILGSSLIILSYVCFPSLRTRARLILVHLALTDMGVGLSNLIGIIVNFDKYYVHKYSSSETQEYQPNASIIALCKAQASFALYCTIGSVLWTLCLAGYMYLLIMSQSQKLTNFFLRLSYFFCYGLPLLVTLWLLCTHRLGYAPYNSSGWCSIIFVRPYTLNNAIAKVDIFSDLLGYNIWIFLTFIIIIPLYISGYLFIKQQYYQLQESTDSKLFWKAMYNIDFKFVLIPVIFIFLRIWSVILSILLTYLQLQISKTVLITLLYLSGIGDSGQGFLNAILFVLSTHNVRKHLFPCSCFKCLRLRRPPEAQFKENLISSDSFHQFKSSDPIMATSKRYSALPTVYSGSDEGGFSITPVSDYSSVHSPVNLSWK